jgi:hypothetical protein
MTGSFPSSFSHNAWSKKARSGHLEFIIYGNAKSYLQSHIRRALMFLDGGAHAMEAGYGLITLACARSLYESAACIHDFCKRLCEMLDKDEVVSAAQFIQERTFSTRFEVEQINDGQFNYTAVNILKQIDALGKVVPGARRSYDQLSETVHPNAYGAHAYFETGRETGIATFSNSYKNDEIYPVLVASASLFALIRRSHMDIHISYIGLMERELGSRIEDYERRKALGLLPPASKSET